MERLEPLSEAAKRSLARHTIWPASIKLVAVADLSIDGSFGESWVVVTDDSLVVTESLHSTKPTSTHRQGGNSKSREWTETRFASYKISDIERIDAENLPTSGMLTATVAGAKVIICRFTNTQARKFGIFAKLFGKVREGQELTDSDFMDDRAPAHCPKCGMLYPDQVRRVCPRCLDRRSLSLRVLSYSRRYKLQIGQILACLVASSALRLLSPWVSGTVLFDEVLGEGGRYYGRVAEIVALIAGTQLLALLISIVQGRINSAVAAEIIYDLKCEIFGAMQRLSLSFFNNKQTGNLMTRVNNDAQHLQYFFHDGLPYFLVNVVTMAGIAVAMVLLDWQLALLVLLPAPFIVFALKRMFPRMWTLFGRRFRRHSAMNSLVNDALTGRRVVKAFGKEASEVSRFEAVNAGVFQVNVAVGRFTGTVFPLVHFAMGLGGLVVWGYGGLQVIGGQMTFGTLITFTGYISMIYGPLEFMTQVVDWWSSCMNSAQRMFEILDAVPGVVEAKNPLRLNPMKGSVSIRDVTFSYEPNKPVLNKINLEIEAGEMVGLVGHSGAGKSTLTNIITRLYDVEEGAILIDGINVKDIAIADLRSQIGMVLQDVFLFSGSIAENIAYAKPGATMAEIIRAARIANAHDFIMRLPDGYDTVIGKRGHDLSGGEKQRISIARAILHDPRILILDEATSSVDVETERQIQEALERLVSGRTTLAIAHRLSTLRNADRLVVLEKGRIAEVGTHAELVKLKGVYYNLLNKQREALRIRGVGD